MDVSHLQPYAKIVCPNCNATVRVRTQMGQYHLTGVLGEGGMSQVFRAVDINLGREVALKILHQSLSQDSALTAMFEREAKLTASILHPNVVKVYTVGNDQGYFFIAMELVDATSLEELIAQKGALPEQDVLKIAHDVTSGLKAAYQEDLIHRDIKPGNMLVTDGGTSKLVDFGLAVQQGGEDESEDLWATPFYVPPEKLEGHSDTYHGDIYSLGATLFHALAGQPPFDANTSSLEELKLIKQANVDLKSHAVGLSKGTLKLIDQMMAYRPEDRPDSYDTILRRIEDIQKREFGVRHGGRLSKSGGNRKLVLLGGAIIGLIALAAVGAYIAGNSDEPEEFGIGTGERVISAGENSNAEKFLRGRSAMAAGDFPSAVRVFETLAQESALSPLTKQWNVYFLGLTKLFLGEPSDSRAAFRKIASIDLDADSAGSDAARFLQIASTHLSDPLPIPDATEIFGGTEIAPLGKLAAGLKNWQNGEFESAVGLMKEFVESEAPDGYSWSQGLKKAVGPYFADFELLKKLPNPSRANSDVPLAEQKAELEAAKKSLKTTGSLPALVEGRIIRVDAIRDRIAMEKKQREEVRIAKAESNLRNNPPKTGGEKAGNEPTEEEKSEIAEWKNLVETFPISETGFAFQATRQAIEALSPETEVGQQMQKDLLAGQEGAARFIVDLSESLNENGYEGVIRRREGVPLDAKITAADPEIFIVDLGFGPNEVATDTFAPDWMVEAAEDVFPPVDSGNFRKWESLVYYAFFTGQVEQANRLGEMLESVAETFSDSWERLKPLR